MPILFTGCFTTEAGKAKFTPIPWQTDTMQRRYPRPQAEVLEAVRKTLSTNGTITGEEALTNVITARVNTRYVWVKVEQDAQSAEISMVTVQVRTKWRNPDQDLAAQIAEQTALNLVK